MSEVAPNTIVKFLKGVPLEATYENTVYWDTATGATRAKQADAFNAYVKQGVTDPISGVPYAFTINNQSYQRYGRNQIRVQIPMDLLLDCNYLMFNNQRFGNKWFYAFITKLEYVNEVTTSVSYEIDVLQTWAFDYNPNSCFIERAHASSDIVGKNLVEENFELGEYMFKQNPVTSTKLSVMGYYIAAPWKADIIYGEQGERTINITDNVGGIYISGIYSGIYINRFSDLEDVKAVIAKASEELGDKAQAIVSLYCAPYQAGVYNDGDPETIPISVTNDMSVFGGYQAHNKKLFTYPYRGIQAFNGNGDSHTYRYEFFEGARSATAGLPAWSCVFNIICDATPSGTCYLVPKGYKQWVGQSGKENWYESFSMGGYPTIAFTTDSYKQYLAQDGVVQVLGNYVGTDTKSRGIASGIGKAIGGVIGGVASIAAGNIAGGLTNVAGSVFGALSENAKADNMPNNTQGATSSGQLKMTLNRQQFQLSAFTITREFAEKIDAFWDWFGYAQKTVATPQRHARKHWTYIKTQGCTINGSIPAEDERKICDLYNNGIRWWVNLSEVGDFYNLVADNKPILEV